MLLAFLYVVMHLLMAGILLLQHAYRDGHLEEVALRHLGAEDGQTVIAKNIRFQLLAVNLCFFKKSCSIFTALSDAFSTFLYVIILCEFIVFQAFRFPQ